MKISVDPKAGYCFGVKNAIGQAEAMLEEDGTLYCLGHIVHNSEEVNRLASIGLKVIDYDEFSKLRNCRVLIRAHGEPPATYETAYRNNITLIDATCPIVKHLQGKIKSQNEIATETNSQVVIYGKQNHPEVNGLVGQTEGQAIVVSDEKDIEKINTAKSVHLYAQTTGDPKKIEKIGLKIREFVEAHHSEKAPEVFVHNTICRQVSNRIEHLEKFASSHDLMLFVSGKESSNGRFLFETCMKANPQSYQIEGISDVDPEWFLNIKTVGISGATSTPVWLFNKIADYIKQLGSVK